MKMSGKIVVGYWDCSYCNAKGISGLEKTCPNCGNPVGKNVKYYMKPLKKTYLDSETAKNYGKGADWVCAYCGSYNRYNSSICKRCGAQKSSSEENYFGEKMNQSNDSSNISIEEDSFRKSESSLSSCYEDDSTNNSSDNSSDNSTNNISNDSDDIPIDDLIDKSSNDSDDISIDSPIDKFNDDSTDISSDDSIQDYRNSYEETSTDNHKKKNNKTLKDVFHLKNFKGLLIALGSIVALFSIIMLLVSIFTPKVYDAQITNKTWDRTISIEELKTFEESDWDVPYGGRVYFSQEELKGYKQEIDHYETVSHQVAKEVFDHYEYEYSDNGDGTFTENRIPKYRTVYETVYEEVPVYVDVPVYDTKYYYEIDRWCHSRNENTSGESDISPYWADFELAQNERESGRNETYTLYLQTEKKEYTTDVSYSEWNDYKEGDKVSITVVGGIVTKVETLQK